ncbi:MAG: hypothetical protein ACFFAY_03245, partial [Promethearchaeota archaeon]
GWHPGWTVPNETSTWNSIDFSEWFRDAPSETPKIDALGHTDGETSIILSWKKRAGFSKLGDILLTCTMDVIQGVYHGDPASGYRFVNIMPFYPGDEETSSSLVICEFKVQIDGKFSPTRLALNRGSYEEIVLWAEERMGTLKSLNDWLTQRARLLRARPVYG